MAGELLVGGPLRVAPVGRPLVFGKEHNRRCAGSPLSEPRVFSEDGPTQDGNLVESSEMGSGRPQTTSKRAIIMRSSPSRLWQCIMNLPGGRRTA